MRHFANRQKTARVANLPETLTRLGRSTQLVSVRYQDQVRSRRVVEIAEALSELGTGAIIERRTL